jgi:RNA polymerase sigma-70 factor (ECF subfamily)
VPVPHADVVFDALYAAHRQPLHAYFVGKTGDADLALDLLQDTFVRVWRNLATLAGLAPERQRAWIFSVARNLVVDQYRARATRSAADAALAEAAIRSDSTSPPADTDLVYREQVEMVDRAIGRLPEDLRTVLVLQVLAGRNSTEVGEILGRPPGTVRYQLAEARRRLVRELHLVEGGA